MISKICTHALRDDEYYMTDNLELKTEEGMASRQSVSKYTYKCSKLWLRIPDAEDKYLRNNIPE